MSTRSKKYFSFKTIKGASLTEFVIVTPIAILFVFCIIQAGLLYMAKLTLNNAVFMAARHGANNHAKESEIKDSLAKGLIPFYIDAFSKPDVASMGIAYGEAKLALINPLNFNKIEIISPSPAMYATYGINSPTGRYIPNDNLEYRDANPRTSADGQISIRDANILKIKVTYAYDINKVPLMATLLRRVMCTGFVDKGSIGAWSASNLQGYDVPSCAYYLNKKLPIVAYATVQMQSNPKQ
jgi:TadE-like protein